MRAGISFHRGPPTSDVFSQHPIMEDPPSLLVDYHSPWQIPDSPLISEEPRMGGQLLPSHGRINQVSSPWGELQNQPTPSLPRRTPPSQRSALPSRHRLRRSLHHRRPHQKGHHPLPQTVPRPRGLPTRHGRPPNPTTHRPHPLNQYLTIGASTPPPNRSSAPSRRNSSTEPTTAPATRPVYRSDGGSKPGATPAGFIPRSDNSHRTNGRTITAITRPHKPSVQHLGGTPPARACPANAAWWPASAGRSSRGCPSARATKSSTVSSIARWQTYSRRPPPEVLSKPLPRVRRPVS